MSLVFLSASFLISLIQSFMSHISVLGAAKEKQVSLAAIHTAGVAGHSFTVLLFFSEEFTTRYLRAIFFSCEV